MRLSTCDIQIPGMDLCSFASEELLLLELPILTAESPRDEADDWTAHHGRERSKMAPLTVTTTSTDPIGTPITVETASSAGDRCAEPAGSMADAPFRSMDSLVSGAPASTFPIG